MLCPYPEISSANKPNSFLLFCSADFARASPFAKDRVHIAAILRVETINATQQYMGSDESISEKNCIPGHFSLKSSTHRIPVTTDCAKTTEVPRCDGITDLSAPT